MENIDSILNLLNKPVKEIMTNNVITTSPDCDVIKSFETLLKHKISCLPVVDENNKLIGILTTTDIGYNLIVDKYTLDTKVSDVMTRDVITISPNDTILEAIKKMDEGGSKGEIINQLPVVDDEGRLVGIVSDGDIIRSLSKMISK